MKSHEIFSESLCLIPLLEIYPSRPILHVYEMQKTIPCYCFLIRKCYLVPTLLMPFCFPGVLLLWSISFLAIWPSIFFFQLRNLCEKNKCPLILNCANEASITVFSGYSIQVYADTKSVVTEYEYKLFMKTVLCALNNALLLITLSHNSWRTLRSPLQIFKKMTWLKQEFCFLKGCI